MPSKTCTRKKYQGRSTPAAPVRELTVRINEASGVKFQKDGYAICSCVILKNVAAPKSIGTQLTIKGSAPFQLYPGQTLVVKGTAARQTTGSYAGRWYLAVNYIRDCADDSTVLKRVLIGVDGIGPKRADNILNTVARYQEVANREALSISSTERTTAKQEQVNALQVIIDNPRILLAAGLNNERSAFVYAAVKEHVTNNNVLDFLYRLDLTDRVIGLIRSHFGCLSHKVLVERIFELTDVRGIGFLTAAMIADKLGVPNDAQQRIRAAIFYSVDQSLSDGSVYATSETLSRLLGDLTSGISAKKFSEVFKELFADGQLVEASMKVSVVCSDSLIPDDVLAEYDKAASIER